MPQKLDICVQHLMADPKFKPRNPKQTKEQAAWAVCNAQIRGTSAKKRADQVSKVWRKNKK